MGSVLRHRNGGIEPTLAGMAAALAGPGVPTHPVSVGTRVELDVGAPAAGGGFVARAPDGRVVFVRHALPGERVVARITTATTRYLRADAIDVVAASPDRVQPPCRFAGPARCGGCDWQHIDVDAQRQLKAQLAAGHLAHLAGVHRRVIVEPVAGDVEGLAWRTRVRFAVDRTGRLGFYRHRSHAVEVVDRCPVVVPEVSATGVMGARWPGATSVEVHAGRTSPNRGETESSATVVARRRGRGAPIRPVVEPGTATAAVPMSPPGSVFREVAGRWYRVSAGVFWQAHAGAPAALVDAVIQGLGPLPGEHAVDLYAGVGLFSGALATEVGPTGSVVAVEGAAAACADAGWNLRDLPQASVVRAAIDAEWVGRSMGPVDLVVLDPPRQGVGPEMARALGRAHPRAVAYVSCDPASFARDLGTFLDAGMTIASLRAFDIFPMTEHVEQVAILTAPGRGTG